MTLRSPCFEALTGLRFLPEPLLHRFLSRHADALTRAGVPLDAPDLPARLWELRSALPWELIDEAERIHDLGNAAGQDRLLAAIPGPLFVAEANGATPYAVATAAFCRYPEQFNVAHGRMLTEFRRRYRAFPGKAIAEPSVSPEAILTTQDKLGAAFEARNRSAMCRVRHWTEPGLLCFAISHGGAVRADDAVEDGHGAPSSTILTWRPMDTDVVLYDLAKGRLRVAAPDAITLRAYTLAFGELLFGDPEWFTVGRVVSLEPLLREGRRCLAPTRDLVEVRLVEGTIELQGAWASYTHEDAFDGLMALQDTYPTGELRRAKLRMKFRSDGRWRSFTLGVPDSLIGDWRRHGAVVMGFLEERGFIAGPSPA